MKWTKKTPTKPGYYWLKDNEGIRIVEICNWLGGLTVLETGSEVDHVPPKGSAVRWAGPLEPPKRVRS
jgi:hypothetical protein